MAQADGSIIVDTELNTQHFAAHSKELDRAIKSLNSKVESLGPTMQKAVSGSASALSGFDNKAGVLEDTISNLEKDMESLGKQRLPTDDYQWLQTAIGKAEQELARLTDRQEKLKSTGVKEGSKTWQNLQYDIDLATQKVDDYKNEAQGLEQTGQAYVTGDTTEQYNQLLPALEAAREKLLEMEDEVDQANDKWAQMPTLSGYIKSAFTSAFDAIGRAASGVKTTVTHPIQAVDRVLGGIAKKGAQAAGALKSMAAAGMKKLATGIKGAASNMLKLFHNTKKSNASFSGGLKAILKYGLGVRSLYLLVNKLRTALVAGFENLAQYSSETNKSISSVKSSLTQLKNSFATAFAPILTVVAPVLTKLINLLSTAVTYAGMFFSALTGSKTFTKAKAVQEDYAASLAGTGTAAKDAAKDVTEAAKEEKRQLAGFDELNVLSADKDTKAEKNDTDSAAAGAGGVSPADMFETVSIDSSISDYVDRIKNAIAQKDWVGVGKLLADGLNLAFGAVDNWITGTLTPKGVLWAGRVADVLNGLVSELDWTLVGKTISDGLNSIVTIVNTFFGKFDFVTLGKQFGTGLKSLFTTVDWPGLGQFLTNEIRALLDLLHGFLETFTPADAVSLGNNISSMIQSAINNINFKQAIPDLFKFGAELLIALGTAVAGVDWYQIGKDVATGLESTDWGLVFDAICNGIGAVLGGLSAFLWGLIEDAWNSVVGWWQETAYEDGKFTIDGLLNGIGEKLADIGSWIKEHIFQPFINGFKAAFGIHSPSTVMSEQGDFLVSGLLQGITGNWSSITGFFSGALGTLTTTLGTGWAGIKNGASTAWSELSANVSTIFSGTKDDLVSTFDNTEKNFANTSSNMKGDLSEQWSSMKQTATQTWTNTKTSLANIMAGLKSNISGDTNAVKTTLNTGFSAAKQTMTNSMNSAANAIKNLGWSGVGSNICSGIGNGINSGWGWLSGQVSSLASSLLSSAKRALGIHSPSRLFRDEVGLNIGYGVGEGIEDSEGSVLNSVTGVADAIADEFNAGDFSIGDVSMDTAVSGLDGVLTGFSDRVSESFTILVERLQAIATGVSFAAPAAANSIAPYQVKATAGTDTGTASNLADLLAGNEEILSAVLQVGEAVVAAIQVKDFGVTIGDETIWSANNRQESKMAMIKGV